MNNKLESKMFWGASEIANYVNVSRTKANDFLIAIRKTYSIDKARCIRGKVPKAYVIDFFNFDPQEAKLPD